LNEGSFRILAGTDFMKDRGNPGWMEWLWRLLRLVLGGIFIYASIDKILHPAQFAQAVLGYKILPRPMVNFFALTLPWVEVVAGICLIMGIFEWASLTLINGLMVVFMIAIATSLGRGLNITCGCFTSDPDVGKMNWLTFLRDLSMLIPGVAAYLLLYRLRRPPIFKQR
jgi:cobalt-zinc-cadmium efflux system protein